MKDGVLYVFDDDTQASGLPNAGAENKDKTVESDEQDMDYAASDLALEASMQEREKIPGFWETWPGYAVIISGALLLLLLAMFFLFFGVIVFAEAEEHDEVFELCGVRLMTRRDGNWCVNLGTAFDDNAVVKLRIGILFAALFEGWDITGEVKGVYEGEVTSSVQQNMMIYRRNIRRSV